MKTYCASDLHIGYECANYPKILSFLELVQKNADQLILCGDIFDLWVNEYDIIKTQEPMKSCFNALVKLQKEFLLLTSGEIMIIISPAKQICL